MTLDVRRCASLEEFGRALVIRHYFGDSGTPEGTERFARVLPLDRMLAAYDRGEVVGGAGAFPFELAVPGGRVRCGGVTVVGVLPTHRRRGILTAMVRAQLDGLHEAGEPVAALWASEGPIYGRFGYGLASLGADVDVPRERSAFAEPGGGDTRVRLVERDEALTAFPAVYDRVLAERPGMFARTDAWWDLRVLREPDRSDGRPFERVLVEASGEPVGYAVYQVHQRFESGSSVGRVEVTEALASTPDGTRAVWRYLLDLDWTSAIRARHLPLDHPLLLLAAEPRRLGFKVGDSLWLRLVDVAAALSARGYADDGELVLEVRDAFCPWNAGRWRLAGGAAERTDSPADLALDVAALGSAYLGGFSFGELADALRVEELVAGAVERADALFRTPRLPWCPEIF